MTGTLDGFSESALQYDALTRTVYRAGSGPAVIVIEELPGITPEVEAFARRVIDAGFTAVLPSLFGMPGKAVSVPYVISSLTRAYVAREFLALKLDRTAPVIGWLRRLAREAHAECGGPGVGVVGMCFTGGFALGMMIDDEILAPVLSQPSVPFAIGRTRRAALGISDDDLTRVKERVSQGACVLGLRFTADRNVPPERFETLRRELGDGFIAVEIDSSPGNAFGIKTTAHSVLTNHLVDQPGHPTRVALDRVLAFLRERLEVAESPGGAVGD